MKKDDTSFSIGIRDPNGSGLAIWISPVELSILEIVWELDHVSVKRTTELLNEVGPVRSRSSVNSAFVRLRDRGLLSAARIVVGHQPPEYQYTAVYSRDRLVSICVESTLRTISREFPRELWQEIRRSWRTLV